MLGFKDEVRIPKTLIRLLRSLETLLHVTDANVIHLWPIKDKIEWIQSKFAFTSGIVEKLFIFIIWKEVIDAHPNTPLMLGIDSGPLHPRTTGIDRLNNRRKAKQKIDWKWEELYRTRLSQSIRLEEIYLLSLRKESLYSYGVHMKYFSIVTSRTNGQ